MISNLALTSRGVAFVLSLFGGSPLHERKALPTRGFRVALQKKRHLFGLVLLCMRSLNKCHFLVGAKSWVWGSPRLLLSGLLFAKFAPLRKSTKPDNQKIKNGASKMISVTQHNSSTNHRNGKCQTLSLKGMR